MLHAKMLVLGVTTYYEDDEDFGGDDLRFRPTRTWMGSANWALAARTHIEFGLRSTEPALVAENYKYLLSLIAFSEQRGASTVGPEPELVMATWTTRRSVSTPRSIVTTRRSLRSRSETVAQMAPERLESHSI